MSVEVDEALAELKDVDYQKARVYDWQRTRAGSFVTMHGLMSVVEIESWCQLIGGRLGLSKRYIPTESDVVFTSLTDRASVDLTRSRLYLPNSGNNFVALAHEMAHLATYRISGSQGPGSEHQHDAPFAWWFALALSAWSTGDQVDFFRRVLDDMGRRGIDVTEPRSRAIDAETAPRS